MAEDQLNPLKHSNSRQMIPFPPVYFSEGAKLFIDVGVLASIQKPMTTEKELSLALNQNTHIYYMDTVEQPSQEAINTMLIEQIATVAHEANKAYCECNGDDSQLPWNEAPEWQRNSAIAGVKFHMKNLDAQPQDSHNSWLKQKEEDGWKYGEVKDAEKKEHPCFVPYDQLPVKQQMKDYIFGAITKAMIGKYVSAGVLKYSRNETL